MLDENEGPLFIRYNNIRQTIPVHIAYRYLGAGAGIIVNQMRNEIDTPVRISDLLKPIEHCRRVRLGIEIALAMRPKALARHNILEAHRHRCRQMPPLAFQ